MEDPRPGTDAPNVGGRASSPVISMARGNTLPMMLADVTGRSNVVTIGNQKSFTRIIQGPGTDRSLNRGTRNRRNLLTPSLMN